MDHHAASKGTTSLHSRFELAPPRRFLLPALLLLLSEEPGYGYSLVKALKEFGFGRVDRPSVYRALAQLEADDLVESWSEAAKAGNARRVYGLTSRGGDVLRAWMGVVKEERACLDRVLRRYQATGTGDAVIAEVEGAWAAVLGQTWSAISSTSPGPGRAHARHAKAAGHDHDDAVARPAAGVSRSPADRYEEVVRHETGQMAGAGTGTWEARRFDVLPERSVVLIEARSTVGPISFGAIGLTGHVEVDVRGDAIRAGPATNAHLEIAVDGLRSGNSLYDAELLRRIDARRFPTASVALRDCSAIGVGDRYRLAGELTFHGVTRTLQGTVEVEVRAEERLVVTGDHVFDIRDFDIASPTVLMLRIYPDVRVRLHVEAELGR